MALKYVVKKTVFGFDKTKAVKYVARPLLAGTVDYSALCDQVTKVGMAPRGVVKMVTDGLIDAIMWNLENHLSVKWVISGRSVLLSAARAGYGRG